MTTKAGLQTPRGSRPLALLALVAIVPLLVLGAVLTQWYAAREQGELDLQLQRAAGRTASAVSRELQAQVDLLSIVAESPRLDFPLQSKSFGEIADRLRLRVPVWSSIRVTDPTGTVLLTSPVADNTINTKVVDPTSHNIVVQTAQPTIGHMVRGPTGNAGFAVRVPVTRAGETVYVVSALLRPSLLTASLASTSLPPRWTSWIVDDRGQIIGATTPDIPELTSFETVAQEPINIDVPWSAPLRIAASALSTSPW
jgi:sensor domain CHASE-containing protein